jgi:uncharacterized protein YllA (UPF0747 family)
MNFFPRYTDKQLRVSKLNELSNRLTKPFLFTNQKLFEEFKIFNSALALHPKQHQNLETLNKGEGVVVVTGQQLGLFTGPFFTLLKIITTIKAATELEQESGIRCIPLFWLQSEDHDFEEIRETFVPRSTGELKSIALAPREINRKNISCEDEILPASISQLLSEWKEATSFLKDGQKVFDILQASYNEGSSLSGALAKTLSKLFADSGLLFFNLRALNDHSFLKETYQKIISSHQDIHTLLSTQNELLIKNNIKPQVALKADSPLLFVHSQKKNNPRNRLKIGENFDFSPELFSSSALIRPIIQDLILPTAAYIGGPGESLYFKQLFPLYDFFSLPAPFFVPRRRVAIADAKQDEHLKSLPLTLKDLSSDDLAGKLAGALDEVSLHVSELEQFTTNSLSPIFAEYEARFKPLSNTLFDSLQKSKDKIQHPFTQLIERYKKALIEKDGVTHDRALKLQKYLYPNGKDQEQIFCGMYFLAKFGLDLIPKLLESTMPFQDDNEVEYLVM